MVAGIKSVTRYTVTERVWPLRREKQAPIYCPFVRRFMLVSPRFVVKISNHAEAYIDEMLCHREPCASI